MVTAYERAIEETIKIALNLPNKSNHTLYKKSVLSIFDDQLQAYTKLNRWDRRKARKDLTERLKAHGIN